MCVTYSCSTIVIIRYIVFIEINVPFTNPLIIIIIVIVIVIFHSKMKNQKHTIYIYIYPHCYFSNICLSSESFVPTAQQKETKQKQILIQHFLRSCFPIKTLSLQFKMFVFCFFVFELSESQYFQFYTLRLFSVSKEKKKSNILNCTIVYLLVSFFQNVVSIVQ